MFSRSGSAPEKRATTRSGGPTQAQLTELRIRARRRLIGALVLVLAAVIIVPWLFQEPVTEQARAPLVVPAAPDGLAPAGPDDTTMAAAGFAESASGADTAGVQTPDQASADSRPVEPAPDASLAAAEDMPPGESATPRPQAQSAGQSGPPASPAPSSAGQATTGSGQADRRTDDGSLALALLEGKIPGPAGTAPAAKSPAGKFVLQAAAYTTEQDALARRDSLRQSGISDAYIEQGQSGGRTVYRLRVGPFGSHQAALAAQTRLRALGYENSLITSQ